MGIHGFHTWINECYPNVSPILNENISIEHIYIDINFCLHIAVNKSNTLEILMKKLYCLIDAILGNVIPTKSITFASDGPAPYAKLLLQRERRLLTSRDIRGEIEQDTITSLCFTPGTIFMNNLKKYMENYIDKLKKNYNHNITINLLLDGPDEAEFKLVKQLLANHDTSPNDKHVIISNDADVCIMSSFVKCYKKIYVAAKLKHNLHLFNTGEFVNILATSSKYVKCPNLDIGTLMLLMGNDYIPKLYFGSFDKIMKSYRQTVIKNKSGLVYENGDINTKFLQDLMMCIVTNIGNIGMINKFSIVNYNPMLYNNYLQGVMWCVKCYKSGSYCDYEYMYKYKSAPHPIGVFHYIINNNECVRYTAHNSVPIPSDIYACLVLPKKAKNLFNNKLSSYIEKKNGFMYEEENCNICKEFRNSIHNNNEVIDYMMCIGDDITNIKKKINDINKKFAEHKKSHKIISFDDIKKIILDLQK